ncbi:MAG: hypothetical protein PHX80_04490 [Candidatus Nanoarchaeia archaeon]|nr:hypothetical protein [Candidatus Nanoarchaeia archaeon]
MDELKFMFNNQDEIDFLMSHINSETDVLEWGSGGSTIEISKICHSINSIEHDFEWVKKVSAELRKIKNSRNDDIYFRVHYVSRDSEEDPGDDGTLENYLYYVKNPLSIAKKFDIILIDGRARVECAKVAVDYLKPGGFIFIHDYAHPQPEYRRYEYEVVEEFLEKVGQVFALAKFKPRIK